MKKIKLVIGGHGFHGNVEICPDSYGTVERMLADEPALFQMAELVNGHDVTIMRVGDWEQTQYPTKLEQIRKVLASAAND